MKASKRRERRKQQESIELGLAIGGAVITATVGTASAVLLNKKKKEKSKANLPNIDELAASDDDFDKDKSDAKTTEE